MADFVVPRHSAVMERLRRRLELIRRHHSSCESRFNSTATERLEVERQQTLALHQRCLQTKAKRTSKHRQPLPGSVQVVQRGGGSVGSNSDLPDSGAGESRNSTLIALQETVKRKLESTVSLLNGDQPNAVRNGFSLSQKPCVEDDMDAEVKGGSSALQSPLDSKHMWPRGTPAPHGDSSLVPDENGNKEHWETGLNMTQDLKQEPVEDILPCMLPSGGCMMNNNLLPDLNLNEQEWKELMEELDDMDIFIEGFEDRKDPELSAHNPQAPLPTDPLSVKGDIHSSWATVDQDPSPSCAQGKATSCRPPLNISAGPTDPPKHGPKPYPPPHPQPLPQQRLLPLPSSTDPCPAQQLAPEEQQNPQLMQRHEQPVKPHAHALQPSWPQTTSSQNTLGGTYSPNQPAEPSSYLQDFPSTNQPPASVQPSSGSSKRGASEVLPNSGHSSLPSHPAGGSVGPALDYRNTKPLCHYEQAPAPQRPPPEQREALLYLLQQQSRRQGERQPFPPHLPHPQEQSSTLPTPPVSGQPSTSTTAGNHTNRVHLKPPQNQVMERFLISQRQKLLMQQEKQQEQQLQRHLTRQPPPYQSQQTPQNPLNHFTGSCQGMAPMGRPEGLATGGQRMFSQAQSMMEMRVGQTVGRVPSHADMVLQSCNSLGPGLHTVRSQSSQPHPIRSTPLQCPPVSSAPLQRPLVGSAPLQRPPAGPAPLQQHFNGSMAAAFGQNQLVPPQHPCQPWKQSMQVLPGEGGLPGLSNNNPVFHKQAHLFKMPNSTPCTQPAINSSQHLATKSSAHIMVSPTQHRARPFSPLQPPLSQQPSQRQPGDFSHFTHGQSKEVDSCPILQCNQGYQVSRTANRDLSFEYSGQSGGRLPSFPEESDFMDSLLKSQMSQEWMDNLDKLLANHQ
ncbi:mastermind-like protein 1 isoform X2 [Megalops cyprinoides]|uniref:mastermind-like protein 1 isoform X2 n=1 Tax=Megalops cyprinoides TaxID=118141 RepID=UPI00186511A3|nr:mastermind-like protein 1 isoform X2 [Megalops cyprinoides]